MNAFKPNPEEIEALVEMAKENLQSAHLQLKEGFLRGAVSSAYYAAFNIAKAVLIKNGKVSKTHSGTLRLFGQEFVKKGKIDKKYGQLLNNLLEERTEADYEALRTFRRSEAEEAISLANDFVEAVKKLI
jgi:hypothetical protein